MAGNAQAIPDGPEGVYHLLAASAHERLYGKSTCGDVDAVQTVEAFLIASLQGKGASKDCLVDVTWPSDLRVGVVVALRLIPSHPSVGEATGREDPGDLSL